VEQDKRKLVISKEELAAAPPPPAGGAAPYPPNAAAPQMPPPVGGQPPFYNAPFNGAAPTYGPGFPAAGQLGQGSLFHSTLVTNLLAGLASALFAWAVVEVAVGESPISSSAVGSSALYFGVFGLFFTALFAAFEDLVGTAWEKAARGGALGAAAGAAFGAASGAIAQSIYGSIVNSIIRHAIENEELVSPTDIRLDLTRALGWAILAVGVGVGAGLARRSAQRTVNALLGGVAGGFVGGFLFNFVGSAINSGVATRFVAFLIIGALIGAAVGLIEVARRQAWIRVLSGGMRGKEFILYWQQANIGSSPKAEITLVKDPYIAPYHMRIADTGASRTLIAYPNCPLAVNGQPVVEHRLRQGDVIQVGTTSLLYVERAVGLGP